MKITSRLLNMFHLDEQHSLLNTRDVFMLFEFFNIIDVSNNGQLNENTEIACTSSPLAQAFLAYCNGPESHYVADIAFFHLMRKCTNLSKYLIYQIFDMLDVDGSGEMDFNEFYLLCCILVSVKDRKGKEFIYRHSRAVYDILDEDGSNTISAYEFNSFGFLFNFEGEAVRKIFNEFDVSGDQELDYKEFRMFAMACIDMQNEIRKKEEEKRQKAQIKQSQEFMRRMKSNPLGRSVRKLMMIRAFQVAPRDSLGFNNNNNRALTDNSSNNSSNSSRENRVAEIGVAERDTGSTSLAIQAPSNCATTEDKLIQDIANVSKDSWVDSAPYITYLPGLQRMRQIITSVLGRAHLHTERPQAREPLT